MKRYKLQAATRRGTADIELILLAGLFIFLILMSAAMRQVVSNRITLTRTTLFEVLGNANRGTVPEYENTTNIQPVIQMEALRPTLPNRVHAQIKSREVPVNLGQGIDIGPVTIVNRAAVVGSSWSGSGYPFREPDRTMMIDWFNQYALESHAFLAPSIGLADSYPP